MLVSLSDLVTCPRCGPTYGLVLLPDEVRDRRVVTGVLGCPNCRERYPVEGGTVDLREPGQGADLGQGSRSGTGSRSGEEHARARGGGGREAAGGGAAEGGTPEADSSEREAAVRLAALLDLAEATGAVLVAGPAAVHAAGVAALVGSVEVVAVDGPDGEARTGAGVAPAVSRLRLGSAIPFRSGSLRGVALTGGRTSLLEEAARVLEPGGRLVMEPAPADVAERLAGVGLAVLAEEGGTVVAVR